MNKPMKQIAYTETEQHIIEAARQIFMEKGFAATSMGDIAAAVGINRPSLHYYFRTKERLYETVSEQIIERFIPSIHDVMKQEISWHDRIAAIVEIYFNMLVENPQLPLFAIREVHRDARHFVQTVMELEVGQYLYRMKDILLAGMENGHIKKMPVEFLFYTFYGLLLIPFISHPVTNELFPQSEEERRAQLMQWKKQVVAQLQQLLCEE